MTNDNEEPSAASAGSLAYLRAVRSKAKFRKTTND
jgi:hypothetical protein